MLAGTAGAIVGAVAGGILSISYGKQKYHDRAVMIGGLSVAILGGAMGGIDAYQRAASEYTRPSLLKLSEINTPILPIVVRLEGNKAIAYIRPSALTPTSQG
jgi:hypothetical protein